MQRYGDKMDIPFMIGTYVLVFLNIIGCAISWFALPKPHHFDEMIKNNQVAAERNSKSSDL